MGRYVLGWLGLPMGHVSRPWSAHPYQEFAAEPSPPGFQTPYFGPRSEHPYAFS